MSYIKYKEKVFCKKSNFTHFKPFKRGFRKLKFFSGAVDPRSWSLDPITQRDYIFEAFNDAVSSCSSRSSLDLSKWEMLKEKHDKSKYLKKRWKSAENLEHVQKDVTELEEKLDDANEKINVLSSINEELQNTFTEKETEVDNLRKLVQDLNAELDSLQKIKLESSMLRAEINSDINKKYIDSQQEINYLTSQLEIFKNFQEKYESLKSSNHKLKEEYDSMKLSIVKLRRDNDNIIDEARKCKESVCFYQTQDLIVSNVLVDKRVLRERVQMRDEKINVLTAFLEEQQMTIQDLAFQLEKVTSNMVKEKSTLGNLVVNLKNMLMERTSRINELQDRLSTSELLIRELENIKNQFRLSNCALMDNMQNYKKQFNIVASCSNKLCLQIENYKHKLVTKDEQIKSLSLFPQSASTVIRLAQLSQMLKTSEESIGIDISEIPIIPRIKTIVDELKTDIWHGSVSCIFELNDVMIQTELTGMDKFTQYEFYFVHDKNVETDIPDQFYFQYQAAQNTIYQLNQNVTSIEDAYYKKDALNRDLQRKIISLMEEKASNEKETKQINHDLELSQEKLLILQRELEFNDSLLTKALHEIEEGKSFCESTCEGMNAIIDSTTYECNKYISVLEIFVKSKEEKISNLQKYITNESLKENESQSEYIVKLENELRWLAESYAKEKKSVKKLDAQVESLKQALREKVFNFKIIQEKLFRAETIFEDLNNIENLEMKSYSTDADAIVMERCSMLLSHSERLKNQMNEDKNFKEKLLKETVSKNYVKTLINNNSMQKKKLKKINIQLKYNMKRVKQILKMIRGKLKIAHKLNLNYQEEAIVLKAHVNELEEENRSLINEVHEKQTKMSKFEYIIQKQENKTKEILFGKDIREKVLAEIIRKLEKYISFLIPEKTAKGTITEGVVKKARGTITDNLENPEIIELKYKIKGLSLNNNDLICQVTQLEGRIKDLVYIPERDSTSLGVQVNNTDDNKIKDMQIHYESVFTLLNKEILTEKEIANKYSSKLKMIQETHEQNIEHFKNIYDEKLLKINACHEDEINRIRLLCEEEYKQLSNKLKIEEIHKKDMEFQKDTEESKLNDEIKELKKEIDNLIYEKKQELVKSNKKVESHLNKVKRKYKKHLNRVKNEHHAEIMQLQNIYNTNITKLKENNNTVEKVEDDASSLLIGDLKEYNEETTFIPEKENEINDSKDFMTDDCREHIPVSTTETCIDINYKESITCSYKESSGPFPEDIIRFMPTFNDVGDDESALNKLMNFAHLKEKQLLLNRITELEKDINQKVLAYENNILIYKQIVRQGQIKIKEIASLLDQEVVYSCGIQHRLGLEFNRAEKLQAEKDDLQKQINLLETNIIDYEIERSGPLATLGLANSTKDGKLRLRGKLEKAIECEKRLTEKVEEDKKSNKRLKGILQSNKIDNNLKVTKDKSDDTEVDSTIITKFEESHNDIQVKSDLKVVFIQQCGILHTWGRNLLH